MKITIRVEGAKLTDTEVKRAMRYLDCQSAPIQVSLGEGRAKFNLAEATVISSRRMVVAGKSVLVIEAETPEAEGGCPSPLSNRRL